MPPRPQEVVADENRSKRSPPRRGPGFSPSGSPVTEQSEQTEMITAGPAVALAGLLGRGERDFGPGAPLPMLWHWVYLLDRPAQTDLGADGHPVRNAVPTPPAPGLRRMFAGGRVRQLAPLRVGQTATRRSAVRHTVRKPGRSGVLTFVTVGHEIVQDGRTVVDDEQDIVYLAPAADRAGPEAPGPEAPGPPPVPPAEGERLVPTDPVMLFRFSALTYNAHRIHYDRAYARDVGGYPGLVVHGPLQALALAEAAGRLAAGTGSDRRFEYRLVAPLFEHQGLVVSASAAEGSTVLARARDLSGRTTGRATLRAPG